MFHNLSMDKSKTNILLLEGIHSSAKDTFQEQGYTQIESCKRALSEDELIEKIKDVNILGIRSRSQLTARIFEAAPGLITVGCFCIGTNQVDLDAATQAGVAVFNAPYSNTRSVAELVLAEAIILLRGIAEKNAKAHIGQWLKSAHNSFEIRGKKLGIVGYGSIGTQLGILAEGLGMDVYFYDVNGKLPLGNAKPVGTLNELLALADVVSMHVPELPSTQNMIGAAEFATMKPNSVFINASRGTVVDINALCHALKSKHLLGAALDVFPVEPRSNDDEFVSPLREFDNVILTPHIGGSTMEAQANIGLEVTEKLIRYHDNGSSVTSVNFPEVALSGHPGSHRLLHIHVNRPGVMSHINSIFSDGGINILGQYLQTNNDVGYVVIDVDADYSKIALERLSSVEGTIRCRRLF